MIAPDERSAPPPPEPTPAGDEAEVLLVFTNFPDAVIARQIGTHLVQEQLAACVNLLGFCESIYTWEGKLESSQEVPALIKTTRHRYPALEAALRTAHPYEAPEIIACEVTAGLPAYLTWVSRNCVPQD